MYYDDGATILRCARAPLSRALTMMIRWWVVCLLLLAAAAHPRPLSPKVLVGYASIGQCKEGRHRVETAVHQGVNVVIWAFYHIHYGFIDIDLTCIEGGRHKWDEK